MIISSYTTAHDGSTITSDRMEEVSGTCDPRSVLLHLHSPPVPQASLLSHTTTDDAGLQEQLPYYLDLLLCIVSHA